jgi:M6 family metalloprotease-like protein
MENIFSNKLRVTSDNHHIITSSPHHIITFLLLFFLAIPNVNAAYLKDIPRKVVQPNGDIFHCFASGDEFYHYIHDADGYTIIQNGAGYYVYAKYDGENIVPSQFVAGSVNPAEVGLQPHVSISNEEYQARRAKWFDYDDIPRVENPNKNIGTLNNLVVFIRFSDESDITSPITTFIDIFNNQTPGYNSMINYFQTTSYGKLTVPSHFFPEPDGNSVLSYQDIYPRSYYQPYHEVTNPNGYQGGDNGWERTEREHQLLKRAIEYIADMVPEELNLDYNNDDRVDNVCFIVKGVDDGWANLLWPHRWSLYTEYAEINGKRVWDYNFITEAGYFNNAVLCHEMQHTLSYPDLYHYYYNGSPCGNWDIMEANPNPPQQSGAYMKWKYGNWLDEPTLFQPGNYTLNSVGNGTGIVSYKIPTSNPQQFFVVEYRSSNDEFENFGNYGNVEGMLIYRINTKWNGNAGYNHSNTFDEVFIFRPGGNYPSTNGSLNLAHFGTGGRVKFDETTNPKPTLTDGTLVTNFAITDITVIGNNVSFTYRKFCYATFHSNGGQGTMMPQKFEVDTAGYLVENSFTYGEREFLGWALTPDGEVEYTDTQSIAINQDITLFAVWSSPPPVYYTIRALVMIPDKYETVIEPEGEIEVLEFSNQTFIIRANGENFVLEVDGNIYVPQSEEKFYMEYTFENVTESHYIYVIMPGGVDDNSKSNIFFTLQPNPATQYVDIILSSSELTNSIIAKIFDIQGLLLKTIRISNEKTSIDISDLAQGTYFVTIGNETKKLIIK